MIDSLLRILLLYLDVLAIVSFSVIAIAAQILFSGQSIEEHEWKILVLVVLFWPLFLTAHMVDEGTKRWNP